MTIGKIIHKELNIKTKTNLALGSNCTLCIRYKYLFLSRTMEKQISKCSYVVLCMVPTVKFPFLLLEKEKDYIFLLGCYEIRKWNHKIRENRINFLDCPVRSKKPQNRKSLHMYKYKGLFSV